jgi:hypothetical protein
LHKLHHIFFALRRFYPNGKTSADRVNTVEKVSVSNPQTGNWQLVISTNALPKTGNQLFSLVITSAGKVVGYP